MKTNGSSASLLSTAGTSTVSNMLSEDHQFIFGARPPVVGKADARTVVNYFWTLIGRLRQ